MGNFKINIRDIIFTLAIIVLCCFLFRACSDASVYEKLTNSQNDTLRKYVNEKGQHVATISILQGSVADFKKLNASKDSTLLHLQQLVDRHTISATVHGTLTGNTFNSNSIIISYDTIRKSDTTYISPKYFTEYKNKWENFKITASNNIFNVNYKVYNEFDHVTRYNRPKWYKARVPEVTVTNLNPNTETLVLKNFTVSPPKGQKLFVFLGGAVVGTLSAFGIVKLTNQVTRR